VPKSGPSQVIPVLGRQEPGWSATPRPSVREYSLFVVFSKRLRDGVRRGEITCSVRIWARPHVKVGGRYRMEEGEIEVASILPIGLADITPELARESGFKGVVDLLKIAKHGKGENIYLVRFHYVPPKRRFSVRRRS
jgi:hypothetical protein